MTTDEFVNPARARIAAGGVALGISLQIAKSEAIAAVARVSDHDFLYVDMQHALFDQSVVSLIAQGCAAQGIAPIARLRSPRDPNAAVLLDCGYAGVVAPDVETVDDAKALVEVTKYAPLGSRSLGGFLTAVRSKSVPLTEFMRRSNETTLVICMVESRKGLANLEQICAVEGVDGVYFGMTDLMADLGKSGQHDDPEVVDAIDRLIAATRQHGKIAGAGGFGDFDRAWDAVRKGISFLNTDSDMGYIIEGAAKRAALIRGTRS